MASGPDLFVVCKSCGSEVSPYITECPYCGHRLRKRAPKIERSGQVKRPRGARVRRAPRAPAMPTFDLDETRRPYATLALLGASLFFVLLVVFVARDQVGVAAHLSDAPWKAVTSVFVYSNVWYELAALLAIGIYGWRLELRHGSLLVLVLFLVCGVGGDVIAAAANLDDFIFGAPGAAMGMLAAWAIPDLRRARRGEEHDGDLLGTLVIAVVVAVMPLATPEASAVATFAGGLLAGLLLARTNAAR